MSYFNFSDTKAGRKRKVDRENEIKNMFCFCMCAENGGAVPTLDKLLESMSDFPSIPWSQHARLHADFIDATVKQLLANAEELESRTRMWNKHVPPRLASFDEVVASGRIDPDAVEVFERTDGMGRSVRTRRAFKRGQAVCSYGGLVLPSHKRPASDYLFLLSNNFIVDGNPQLPEAGGHVGKFVNDAAGPIRAEGVTNNLRFTTGTLNTPAGERVKTVLLKAKRNLPENTELFVGYGSSYWPRSKKAKTR